MRLTFVSCFILFSKATNYESLPDITEDDFNQAVDPVDRLPESEEEAPTASASDDDSKPIFHKKKFKKTIFTPGVERHLTREKYAAIKKYQQEELKAKQAEALLKRGEIKKNPKFKSAFLAGNLKSFQYQYPFLAIQNEKNILDLPKKRNLKILAERKKREEQKASDAKV